MVRVPLTLVGVHAIAVVTCVHRSDAVRTMHAAASDGMPSCAAVVSAGAATSAGHVDGVGAAARLSSPAALSSLSDAATVYFVDGGNRLKQLHAVTGAVTTAASGLFSTPYQATPNIDGVVYVSEGFSGVVRAVDLSSGVCTTSWHASVLCVLSGVTAVAVWMCSPCSSRRCCTRRHACRRRIRRRCAASRQLCPRRRIADVAVHVQRNCRYRCALIALAPAAQLPRSYVVCASGTFSSFCGSASTSGFVDGHCTVSRFGSLRGMALADDASTCFVADAANGAVRSVDTSSGEWRTQHTHQSHARHRRLR